MKYRKAATNYQDWLEDRAKYPSIGASQSASIMGLNPWQTKVDVWHDLVYGADYSEDNLAMRLGREMEPILRKLFMEQTGLKVLNDNKIRIHENYDYITTNLDGFVVGEKVPVEYKTTAKPWDGEIPDHYFVQLQHQMMVSETPYSYFASLSMGFNKQLIIEKYNRNDEFIEELESNLVTFWEDHVLTKIAPDPETIGDAQKLYNSADDEEILEADDGIYNICKQLNDLNAESKSIVDQTKELKLELMKSLENKQEMVYNGSTLCTWRKAKDTVAFDKKTFKDDHPELFEQYAKTRSGSRRFILKKMEE